MMRTRDGLACKLVQRAREALRHTPRIHEQQRRGTASNDLEEAWMNRLPNARPLRPLRRGTARQLLHLTELRHVLYRYLHTKLQQLARAGVDNRHRAKDRTTLVDVILIGGICLLCSCSTRFRTAEKPSDLLERPLRRAETDALNWPRDERLQPLQRERQMCSTFRRHQRMNLIDDHRLDRSQRLTRTRGQHQVQRLRRCDEDLAGMPSEARTIARACIACAHTDLRNMRGDTLALRHVRDSCKR